MTWVLRLMIRVYQLAISPYMAPSCRFHPTCSEYAAQALDAHGLCRGSWMALIRLGRCHPWGGFGDDPVPPTKSATTSFGN